MWPEFYFLPILLRALDEPVTSEAYRTALTGIIENGQSPEHKGGHARFVEFWSMVEERLGLKPVPDPDAIAVEAFSLVLGDPAANEAIQTALRRFPLAGRQYDRLLGLLEPLVSQYYPLALVVERNGTVVGRFDLQTNGLVARLAPALPGSYSFCLSTGRVLWSGDLTKGELVIGEGGVLALAAESGHPSPKPSRTLSLLEGEIAAEVYPGLEHGTLVFYRRK